MTRAKYRNCFLRFSLMLTRYSGLAFLVLIPTFLLAADVSAEKNLFDFKQVADGVYAAIAKPAFRTNCNSAIVLMDDGVLVVDSQSKPSAAQAVIDQIKQLSNKPVKYLVITHFHNDHTQGIQAYVRQWPGIQIISTTATRNNIDQRTEVRLQREAVTLPAQIEKMKSDLAKASDTDKAQIQKNLSEAEAYLEERKQIELVLPKVLVDENLSLHRDSGDIEIFSFPHAHTEGDLVLYLPTQKLLITGDIIHGAQPITKDGYFVDWISAIDDLGERDFRVVIGGHGDVLHDRTAFDLWTQYFRDLLDENAKSYAAGESLDAARKRLVPMFLQKYGSKFPKRYSETVTSDVEKAYRVVSGATE